MKMFIIISEKNDRWINRRLRIMLVNVFCRIMDQIA